jgi:HAMP domain-containing protein
MSKSRPTAAVKTLKQPESYGLRKGDLRTPHVEAHLERILEFVQSLNAGDLSVHMDVSTGGVLGDIAMNLNSLVGKNRAVTDELARVSNVVGRDGRLSERASLPDTNGFWKAKIESVNSLIGDLARPTTDIARVIQAVATGDLSQKITAEARGDISELKSTINTMVDTLRSFSSEVTRVAKEVGTEGKLGGQAAVQGVSGTWKELTDNVNSLASNLTNQVRNIAKVTTAVAIGIVLNDQNRRAIRSHRYYF